MPEAALERGVTYFDTAPDYADAGSETILGEAMKGQRDKIFLATKFCRPDGHLPNDTPVPKIIEAVEAEPRVASRPITSTSSTSTPATASIA